MLVKELYEKVKKEYSMELLTGEQGVLKHVQWVHIIEDFEVTTFIHGNELIFTTGIANEGDAWLLDFVKSLYENHACGVVINIGPYIKEVPMKVISFCEEHGLPLFTMPWEVRLVDVTKSISGLLLDQEKRKASIVNTMKDAIFYASGNSTYQTHLKRYGFYLKRNFCPILLETDMKELSEEKREQLLNTFENVLEFYFPKTVVFKFNQYIVIVLYNFEKDGIVRCLKKIEEFQKQSKEFSIKTIVAGPNESGVENLAASYQCARNITRLANVQHKNQLIYDEMGIYQLLLTNPDKGALHRYYENTLGSLKAYDHNHNTDYFRVLKVYMETDCSVQETAKKEFCHRNTINQRIYKIRDILGRKNIGIHDKVEIMMAYAIYELL